jgi:hypothetical protein
VREIVRKPGPQLIDFVAAADKSRAYDCSVWKIVFEAPSLWDEIVYRLDSAIVWAISWSGQEKHRFPLGDGAFVSPSVIDVIC